MLLQAAARALTAAGVGPGARLCCALSGGVDSVVVLDLLHALAPRHGFLLQVAHVHHGLSPNADAWAQACEARCAQLQLPFSLLQVVVPRDDAEGLEAAARRLRHAALDSLACDWLVFGHHQNDQAETLLFRLLRGSGVRGAAAMLAFEPPGPARPGRLRPLLDCDRTAIETWARKRSLNWVEDESNIALDFTRNHLRHRVLPIIGERFPAAVPALARAAGHFREASDLLDALAVLDQSACGGRLLQRDRVLALSDARVANLLRWLARQHGFRAPSRARLDEALRQLRSVCASHPLRLALGDMACCAYRGRLWLEPAAAGSPQPRRWSGEDTLEWAPGSVSFQPALGQGIARAALDGAAVVMLAQVRPGLRMRLGGGRARRSLRKLCQEAGIPAWMRERLPVLWINDEPAWIGGIGLAADFACPVEHAGLVPQWHEWHERSDD
ncbi:MAG TPA: tRNA lysidine(34) synthetase TilS [Thauera sp.]|nr:tRNA lysidine(34) synthetase TilS [Thauera sp.]